MLANVSLASADPIGPPAAWPAVINAWLTEARTYGWFPAVLSCSEQGAQAYVAAGLKAITLGDEAIIDVDGFTLDGPAMEPVRRAVRRVQRAGYVLTVIRQAELTSEQLAEVARRAEDWRGDDTERGFSMALGRVDAPEDGDCVTVLAHDGNGALRGVLSFVPWGQRGLSLHLMRRDPDRRERPDRGDGRGGSAGRARRARRATHLAELRDVPRHLQRRRPGRRPSTCPAREQRAHASPRGSGRSRACTARTRGISRSGRRATSATTPR